jgi:hypothetical protein
MTLIKKITNDTEVDIRENYSGELKEVESVKLYLNQSTSRARIFNLALKLAVFPWQEPILNRIEEMADARILEIANGKDFIIRVEREEGSVFTTYITATNSKRAKKIIAEQYPKFKIISVIENRIA